MKRYIGLSLGLVFFVGCATITGTKMHKLREGMARQNVERILGIPDGFNRIGEYEHLQYANRLASGYSKDRADYNVILKDGKVVSYGQGTVRVKDSGTSPVLFIVPIQ